MRTPWEMDDLLHRLGMRRPSRWAEGEGGAKRLYLTWPAPENGGTEWLDAMIEWEVGDSWLLYVDGATPEQWERIPIERQGFGWPAGVGRPWGEMRDLQHQQENGSREARAFGDRPDWVPGLAWGSHVYKGRVLEWGTYTAPYRRFVAVTLDPQTGVWWVTCNSERDFDALGIPEDRRARSGRPADVVEQSKRRPGRPRAPWKPVPTRGKPLYRNAYDLRAEMAARTGIYTIEEVDRVRAEARAWAEDRGYEQFGEWETMRGRESCLYQTPHGTAQVCVWPRIAMWGVLQGSKVRAALMGVPDGKLYIR